jgi:aspartyl-tRNA(Asn)/glutamyl-tRNA(Gln) amidotransferase subunit A
VGDAISFPEASLYHRERLRERPDGFSPRTRANLQLGEFVLATDYLQAQRVRTVLLRSLLEVFEEVDLIATPTTPVPALRVGDEAVRWAEGECEQPNDAYCRLT